jgi:hypothetical protein
MNRVHPLSLGDCNDCVDVEVRPHRLAALRRTNQKCLVGLEAMKREAILVAVDRHRPETQLGGGPEAADGDLRTVGDE